MHARLVPLPHTDDRLLRQWRELALDCLEPNPFFEPAMTLNAAALPDAPPVALLVVEGQGRLHLLAPVCRTRRYRRTPVPALTTWEHAYNLLGTPLVGPADPVAAFDTATRLLVHDRVAPWWVLGRMAADGPVAGALHEALWHRRLRATPFLSHERAAVLGRSVGGEGAGGMGARTLKSLRRRRRRLSEQLGAEIRTVDTACATLGEAVEGFLVTEARGWKGQDGGAFLSRPGHADFFRALCRDFSAEGRLQFYALGTSTTSVAYQCNLTAQDRVFNFKIAYDEEFRSLSPGVLLDLDTLAAFHAQDRLDSIDSCASPDNAAVNQLFPDALAVTSLLVPLSLRGRAAAAATTAMATTAVRLRRWSSFTPGGGSWKKRL